MITNNQKEIGKRILEIHDIIDFIDDGYHGKEINNLIMISNDLFYRLNKVNQEKIKKYYEEKYGLNGE